MAKFASPQLKDALSDTILEEELFERKKKDMAALKKENPEVLKPDFARAAEEVLQDIQYKGVVARAVGKDFSEREYISQKDLEKLMLLSEITPNFGKRVEARLIPIMKSGRKWEDRESRKLRKQYVKKSQELLDILSKFQFKGVTQSEEIYLDGAGVFDKTTSYLEFASAVALLDKGVRKRKSTRASGSIYFKEVYANGKRGALFGVFDGFDERGLEYLPASLAAGLLKEKSGSIAGGSETLSGLNDFMRAADGKVSESVKGFCGTSASCGMVLGKQLHYANVGSNRIYGVKANGQVEKIAGDEIAKGISDREQMYSEIKYPYLYLGGFTQRMKGKKSFRVIHTDFRLGPPHTGSADISRYAGLFVANSGVWKSALVFDSGGVSLDDRKLEDVFSRARNPINAVERMDMQVKNFMRQSENRSMVDDIAMLYFSV